MATDSIILMIEGVVRVGIVVGLGHRLGVEVGIGRGVTVGVGLGDRLWVITQCMIRVQYFDVIALSIFSLRRGIIMMNMFAIAHQMIRSE